MEDSEFALEHVDLPEINICGSFVEGNFEIMRVNITKNREKKGTETWRTFSGLWKGWRGSQRSASEPGKAVVQVLGSPDHHGEEVIGDWDDVWSLVGSPGSLLN